MFQCYPKPDTYYGYKLHGITSVNGVIKYFDVSKASKADIHFLKDIKPSHLKDWPPESCLRFLAIGCYNLLIDLN